MAEYEVVREVQNLCANNQMRDVFFDEIETDAPVEWIRREVKGKEVNLTVDRKADGSMITLALGGLDVLFVVSQWPARRAFHLRTLLTARAIENQCFTVGCNACGQAGPIVFGGGSVILDPWGRTLAECGPSEDRCTADCDPRLAAEVRAALPVFADRRPTLYRI